MEQQVGILRAQLARKTGCNLETIRYYEKVGLLPGPPRSSNGYRVDSPELGQRLQVILRARDLAAQGVDTFEGTFQLLLKPGVRRRFAGHAGAR